VKKMADVYEKWQAKYSNDVSVTGKHYAVAWEIFKVFENISKAISGISAQTNFSI